jgi:hypothetical protein
MQKLTAYCHGKTNDKIMQAYGFYGKEDNNVGRETALFTLTSNSVYRQNAAFLRE